MGHFTNYLQAYGPELQERFAKIRRGMSDSDVKGGQNERIVAEFLEETVPADFVARSVQIIDSYDRRSHEVDVAVCNRYQIFRESGGGLLIAEGVDFTSQVKAVLTTAELERAFKNCATVKAL